VTVPFDGKSMPHWVRWVAQDASGVWWGYSVEPLRCDHGWYENEVGEYIRLGKTEAAGWRNSLCRIGMTDGKQRRNDETR